jgi:hypothetical protein
MAIDKRGKYWKGTDFSDVVEYAGAYTEDDYPADTVRQCVCACGGTVFQLQGDAEEGCVRRICVECRAIAFIADSEEAWKDARPRQCACPCKGNQFEVGVAFSLRPEGEGQGEVRWITVCERCVKCGTLGAFADWKIDYAPSRHLLDQI